MARFPRWLGVLLAIGAGVLSASMIPDLVFAADQKSDWRGASLALSLVDPTGIEPVLVTSNDPKQNLEIVTARYYLRKTRPAFAVPGSMNDLRSLRETVPNARRFWLSCGVQDGWLTTPIPEWLPIRRQPDLVDLNGLRFIAVDVADLPAVR